jgi:hypothetical protein
MGMMRSNLLETRVNVRMDDVIGVGVVWMGTGSDLEKYLCWFRCELNRDTPGGDLRMPPQGRAHPGPLAHLGAHPLQELC